MERKQVYMLFRNTVDILVRIKMSSHSTIFLRLKYAPSKDTHVQLTDIYLLTHLVKDLYGWTDLRV